MIYFVTNGHELGKIGWTERTIKNQNGMYPRQAEYLAANPDSIWVDVIPNGNKQDEVNLRTLTAKYRLEMQGQREWLDLTNPAAYDDVMRIFKEYKEMVNLRTIEEAKQMLAEMED